MSGAAHAYRLRHLTDPAYPPFRLRAGGDVRLAVAADTEQFLRALSEFAPGSVSAAVRFLFRPAGQGMPPQQRLTVCLLATAHEKGCAAGLDALVERGPLRRLLELEPVDAACIVVERFGAACGVVRRLSLLDPTIEAEFNAKALPAYSILHSFQPRPENDYLLLDSVLDGVREPVTVDIRVEPAGISRELAAHAGYLASLQEVNRSWDFEENGLEAVRWSGAGGAHVAAPRASVKPLRTREPLADDVLRRQQRFHETLTERHLRFHICAFAETAAIARLVGSVVAESAFEDGTYELVDASCGEELRGGIGVQPSALSVKAVVAGGGRAGMPSLGPSSGLLPLVSLAPVAELTSVFRLPIASEGSPHCIRKNTDAPSEDARDLICIGSGAKGGGIPSTVSTPHGIRIDRMAKHVFISGVPGSGKTTCALNLLMQLAGRGIPVLIFEPGKSEYRLLKCLKEHSDSAARRLARTLAVYAPGNERISPFRFNPLQVPEGIGRDEHIENVLNCFKAAMPMSGPLPALLGEALEEVYESHSDPEHPPRMADLYRAARAVLARKGYSGEVDSDIRAAIDVRLGLLTRRSIGRVFQCARGVPAMRELLSGSTLLELAALPIEVACLLTLTLLTVVREQLKAIPHSGAAPRLVILLEEAHNLVGRSGDARASEENADPRAFAAEFICRMLAELRGLGVGIVILDQLPSAVAPEVVKLAGSKVCFRQVAQEERELIGGTMLFGPIEMEETARLQPGEAYFYTEGYFGPQRVRAPNLHAVLGLPDPPVGTALRPWIHEDPWFVAARKERLVAEAEQLKAEMDRFDALRTGVAARAAKLVAARPETLAMPSAKPRRSRLAELARDARVLRDELASAARTFSRDVYRPLLGEGASGASNKGLRALVGGLESRFRQVIRQDTESCLDLLGRLASQCERDASLMKGT